MINKINLDQQFNGLIKVLFWSNSNSQNHNILNTVLIVNILKRLNLFLIKLTFNLFNNLLKIQTSIFNYFQDKANKLLIITFQQNNLMLEKDKHYFNVPKNNL